jgi:HEPN domain-containing protein
MSANEAMRWLDYSLSDIKAAQKLLAEPDFYPRHVCFLSQQSAEKALKAVLVFAEVEVPFSHDLD